MTDYLRIEYETTLRDIDAALAEFHIELPGGGAAHRDHGVHLLVGQLRRAEAEVERLRAANARLVEALTGLLDTYKEDTFALMTPARIEQVKRQAISAAKAIIDKAESEAAQ